MPAEERAGLQPVAVAVGTLVLLSLTWGGMRPLGIGLLHLGTMLCLIVSFRRRPPMLIRLGRGEDLWIGALLFLAWSGINYFWKGAGAAGLESLLVYAELLMLVFVIARTERPSIDRAIQLWIVAVSALAVVQILLALLDPQVAHTPRPLRHAFHFGLLALMLLGVGLGRGTGRQPKGSRLPAQIGAAIGAAAVLVDGKTAPQALLALGALLILLPWGRTSDGNRRRMALLIVGALVLVVATGTPRLMGDLVETIRSEGPLAGHLPPWITAIRAWSSAPLTGIGWGSFPYYSGQFEPIGLDQRIDRAHGLVWEILAETGLFGLLLAGWALWCAGRRVLMTPSPRALSRQTRRGIWTALGLALLLGQVDFGLQVPANAVAVAILVGLLLADNPSSRRSRAAVSRRAHLIPLLLLLVSVPWVTGAAFWELGRSAESRGNWVKASRRYRWSRVLRPGDDRVALAYGRSLHVLSSLPGRAAGLAEAARVLDRAVQLNPHGAESWMRRGLVLLRRAGPGDGLHAIRDMHQALELDPSSARYAADLARALGARGQIDGARQILATSSHRASGKQCWTLAKVPSEILLADQMEVSFLVRWVVQDAPSLLSPLILDMVRRAPEEPLIGLTRILREDAGGRFSFEAGLALGDALAKRRQDDLALWAYQSVLGDSPPERRRELLLRRILVLRRGDRSEEALAVAEEAVREFPVDRDLQTARARLLTRAGRAPESVQILQDLARLHPDSASVHGALSEALRACDRRLEALEALRIARGLNPQGAEHSDPLVEELGLDPFWSR